MVSVATYSPTITTIRNVTIVGEVSTVTSIAYIPTILILGNINNVIYQFKARTSDFNFNARNKSEFSFIANKRN
jgi:hypothetical protein